MRIWLLLILAAGFAVGCRQGQPSTPNEGDDSSSKPQPVVKPAPLAKPELTAEEIEKRLATEFADVYVILPQTQEYIAGVFADKLVEQLKPFLDEQNPSRMETKGTHWFMRVKAAPVKDVEAFGSKQKLGRVLACDPAKRSVLIEYGAAAAPRATWKDAGYLDRQVTARSARWGLLPPPGYPAGQIVYVRFRGDWSKEAFATQGKLKALLDGPAEKRHVWTVDRDPFFGDWATAMAPAPDLAALVKNIDFADVVFYDTEHNALILGPPRKGK